MFNNKKNTKVNEKQSILISNLLDKVKEQHNTIQRYEQHFDKANNKFILQEELLYTSTTIWTLVFKRSDLKTLLLVEGNIDNVSKKISDLELELSKHKKEYYLLYNLYVRKYKDSFL